MRNQAKTTVQVVESDEAGESPGSQPQPKRPRMTAKMKKELVEIGVDRFAELHNYKGKGRLSRMYKDLTGKPWKAAKKQHEERSTSTVRLKKTDELQSIITCVKEIEKYKPPAIRRILSYISSRFNYKLIEMEENNA